MRPSKIVICLYTYLFRGPSMFGMISQEANDLTHRISTLASKSAVAGKDEVSPC